VSEPLLWSVPSFPQELRLIIRLLAQIDCGVSFDLLKATVDSLLALLGWEREKGGERRGEGSDLLLHVN
jgi:hypothetical protein